MEKRKPKTSKTEPIVRLLVKSSGMSLRVQENLMAALAINRDAVYPSEGEGRTSRFLQQVELAWVEVWRDVANRQPNFITWLRGAMIEGHQVKLWVPEIFLRRVGELSRGELRIVDNVGAVPVPRYDHMPSKFIECANAAGWNFPIAATVSGRFEDYRTRIDVNPFVDAALEVWGEWQDARRPASDARKFINERMVQIGYEGLKNQI